MNAESKILISLGKYLELPQEGKSFIIPDYQRGYIWGKINNQNKPDAVSYICYAIANAFENNKESLFLQGITYCNDNGDIMLVDGQQRTTFFYILLKYLGFHGNFNLKYNARKNSEIYLKSIKPDVSEFDKEKNTIEEKNKDLAQDIFFFNRTMRIIREYFGSDAFKDKHFELLSFVLNNIKFICIKINLEEAPLIFTMMNSQKAEMLQTELIKSELLRVSSLNSPNSLIIDSENVQIRSRLAREWDKWLKWWNRPDVSMLYVTRGEQLGWLLKLFLNQEEVNFTDFRKKLKENSVKVAKKIFEELRLLQKRLEDAFYIPRIYNFVGFILRRLGSKELQNKFMYWYFVECRTLDISARNEALKFYFDNVLLGVRHDEIIGNLPKQKIDSNHINDFLKSISEPLAYNLSKSKQDIKAWLTRRNILEDNNQGENEVGRKFDFSIWDCWSLEHILPKSKVFHTIEATGERQDHENNKIDPENYIYYPIDRASIPVPKIKEFMFADKITEHSLGNLVLLYGHNNSEFRNDDFKKKKDRFFDPLNDAFKSRHLLHTVKVFANSQWGPEEITKQYEAEIKKFLNDFIHEQ